MAQAPTQPANRWRNHRRPLVIAHRGHSTGAPEQTRASYVDACRRGAHMIEADVRRSRDGHLVLLHDATVDRTTNGHGPVAELGFDELRRLDAGGWFAAEFTGEQVPSLDELFDLAYLEGIALCLEAKGETPRERTVIACSVAARIAERGRLDQDVLASFDHVALATAVRKVPGLQTAPDRLPERGPSSAPALAGQARLAGAQIIQHHHADLYADVVEATHAAGLAIWAWPTTSSAEIERALALGVDAVMGDDVTAMVSAVAALGVEPIPPAR